MEVRFRVNVGRSVKGQEIADAVKEVADNEFHQELVSVSDEGRIYLIGQKSYTPYRNLIIGVGSKAVPEVAMDSNYWEVYVLSWDFGGETDAVGYSQESIVGAVQDFSDRLQEILIQ